MNSFLLRLFASLILLLPLSTVAQDDGVKANVSISPGDEGVLWTGQQVTLNLDLKTTGFSFSNTHFNLPEIDGAFLMQTDTTTIKMTEQVAGENWQVVRYPLALYPQKAGKLSVPPIDVRFTSAAGFGSAEQTFELQSEPLELTIELPPGVNSGDLVVTTTAFELDHSWQPDSTAAQTGDAVTLRVSRSAANVSAMLLPPLPVFRSDGLAAYPQAPELSDQTNRGKLTGVRTDSIIWVIEQPGEYQIPGIRFQWWDPVKRELKQQVVAGLSLDVPAPASQADTARSTTVRGQQSDHTQWLLWVFLAGLLAALAWVIFNRKKPALLPDTEKTTFARVQKACHSNEAPQAYAAIHAWLEFYSPPAAGRTGAVTLRAFAKSIADEQLLAEMEKLQKAVISPGEAWQGARLSKLLKNIRQRSERQITVQSESRLAPLNP